MITTGKIKVNLNKGQTELTRITTKNVDASIKIEHPTEKPVAISTRNLPDVADIAEKKRRDDIMAESEASPTVKLNGKGMEELNRQFVFVDIFEEGEIQCFPRRELK